MPVTSGVLSLDPADTSVRATRRLSQHQRLDILRECPFHHFAVEHVVFGVFELAQVFLPEGMLTQNAPLLFKETA